MHPLKYRRETLQPHAGIHRGARQRGIGTIRIAVELHEHQVPDFDVSIAIRIGGAGRATSHLRAMIVENLTARPAWTGITHRPEIIAGPNSSETRLGYPDLA